MTEQAMPFKGVGVEKSLEVELVPKVENPGIAEAPMINFIEAIREDGGKITLSP